MQNISFANVELIYPHNAYDFKFSIESISDNFWMKTFNKHIMQGPQFITLIFASFTVHAITFNTKNIITKQI